MTNITTPIQTSRLSDTDLERIEALLKDAQLDDPALAQAWARNAFVELGAALRDLQEHSHEQGGDFARRLRELVGEAIEKRLNGAAILTGETVEESLAVHVLPNGVVVDVRMWLGRWKEHER